MKRKLGFPDARMEPLASEDAADLAVNPELDRLVRQVVSRMEERG